MDDISPPDRWAERTIDDVLSPDVRLLLVGINPGRRSAELNRHFAGPGNRFWPALSASGLVPGPIGPAEQHELPAHGIGITNLVARATATAAEVTREELRAGGAALVERIAWTDVRVVAVLGVTAYRVAFAAPRAARGPQPDRPGWWLMDNPSGLNAHAQVPELARQIAAAGRAAGLVGGG
ncbi:mismatch-specific DNA-glycosylase [Euzebya sp.]|uniref:mismatch-specific DNA-glycosylase n=1 Tax=Euzebya sp. TaxID=1971409 RepID=UPI003513EC83